MNVKAALAWADGKKRYLLLLVFLAESIAGLMGNADLANTLRMGLALLGWDPSQAVVGSAVVGQFVVAGWAIMDGVRKDRAARAVTQ
jgi:hypothetical protein